MTGPALHGIDLFGEAIRPESRGKIADAFLVPPFSVLNAREGFWQERKRAWVELGIESEVGRQDDLLKLSAQCTQFDGYRVKEGLRASTDEQGASIFDPVLCELAYRWFCPPAGLVLDPFAGGSVRGIVAALLDRQYVGIELRPEQIASNREQAAAICQDQPRWIEADAVDIGQHSKGFMADFVFSCPPYGDLERYSDDPRDLSTLPYPAFREKYRAIIKETCGRLKDNRFACFVVGDFRDQHGHYRNFVSDTIGAFLDAGLKLYNEAILITAVGSLSIRIGKQFTASRKMGKTHQNVLVFVKGSAEAAARLIEAA